jgi:uracil-DNA glycosylase
MSFTADKFFSLFPITQQDWKTLVTQHVSDNLGHYSDLVKYLEPQLQRILPPKELVFNSLNLTSPTGIRVVIIGQDPYPTPGEACGLAFATKNNEIPASLRNIFKEIYADCGGTLRTDPDLTDWAQQGILLLNTSLTVLEHKAGVHSTIGWQRLTSYIVEVVLEKSPNAIFLLWGKHARGIVTQETKNVLVCSHPSPLAYGKGGNNFKGCGHFKKTNELLIAQGLSPINWNKNT